MSISTDIAVWLGALATLALYSILYRENVVYRAAEHIFIGLGTGYGIYITVTTVLFPQWWQPMVDQGRWPWIFAFVAGALYYAIYTKRFVWMSRWIMITMMGLSAGIAFKGWTNTYLPQIASSFKPILTGGFPYIHFTNLIFIITLVSVMVYFLFSFEHRSPFVRGTAGTGRWLMMVAFGAIFGSTVMARMSLFISRLYFLFHDWIQVIPDQ
jgi:hypothetical protein